MSAQHTPPWQAVELSPFIDGNWKPYWQVVRHTRPIGQTLKGSDGKPQRFRTEAEALSAIAKATGSTT